MLRHAISPFHEASEYCNVDLQRKLSLTLPCLHILSYSCFHFTDPSDGQVDGENTDEKVMGGEGQIPPKVRKTLSEKDIN